MKKIFIVILLGVIVSCTSPITEGHVVKKMYEPERTYTQMVPITRMSGKTTVTTYIPQIVHDDEDFYVIFENKNEDGEVVQRTIAVQKSFYERVSTGDYIDLDPDDNINVKGVH